MKDEREEKEDAGRAMTTTTVLHFFSPAAVPQP